MSATKSFQERIIFYTARSIYFLTNKVAQMNRKLFLLLPLYLIALSDWHTNLDEAKNIAREEHKFILLNFSGSDWCGPCMRMRKEIFESKTFREMAASDLVLVNADFPRKKKNQLSA